MTSVSTFNISICFCASIQASATSAPTHGTPVASNTISIGSSARADALSTTPPCPLSIDFDASLLCFTYSTPARCNAFSALPISISAQATRFIPGIFPICAARPEPIWPAPANPTLTGLPNSFSRAINSSV